MENAETNTGRSNKTLIVVAISVGIVLVGAILAAAIFTVFSGLRGSSESGEDLRADARGVSHLEIDSAAGDFSIAYDAEPDSATLEVRGEGPKWQLEREGDRLRVESAGTFGLQWFGGLGGDRQLVVLHLPRELENARLDVALEMSSGSVQLDGGFGLVDVEVSSGALFFTGSAETFDASVSSGSVEFGLEDVRELGVDVSSGRVVGALTGEAPRESRVAVSSGFASLALPDREYAVQSQVSSGSLENQLRTDPDSANRIDLQVSSGRLELRPAR